MTIDGRIDKLAERHEALAQSVELLVAQGVEARKMVEETSASVNEMSKTVHETSKAVHETSKAVHEMSKTVDIVARSVYEIAGAIQGHEKRIIRLEDRAA